MPDQPKKQLHNSDLQTLFSCGERFFRRKIRGEKEPMSTALVAGKAVHRSAYDDLTSKVTDGALLPTDDVKQRASEHLQEEWNAGELLLNEREREQGLETVKGGLVDLTVAAATLHHTHLAPTLNPVPWGLEFSWVLEAHGFPYDLAGQLDVLELIQRNDREEGRVRDLKFVKKAPSQHEAEQSSQLTLYSMAIRAIKKLPVEEVAIDAIIKPTKTLGPRLITLESRRTEADGRAFVARFEQAVLAIERGIFMPANPSEPWAPCHYCGFKQTCRYYSKRPVVITTPLTIEGGTKNGKPQTSIARGSAEWTAAITD